jgi:D-alanyl-D-alanine dipeptidase
MKNFNNEKFNGAPVKKEGDKKSPAGIFTIGPAFGYPDKKDTAKAAYNSFEYMHRLDNYYKWGLFIYHNSGNVVPGDGPCIFMHIWENDNEGTDGCTAMKESNILRVLHWINYKDNPLLVQLPKAEYRKLRAQFGLPGIRVK